MMGCKHWQTEAGDCNFQQLCYEIFYLSANLKLFIYCTLIKRISREFAKAKDKDTFINLRNISGKTTASQSLALPREIVAHLAWCSDHVTLLLQWPGFSSISAANAKLLCTGHPSSPIHRPTPPSPVTYMGTPFILSSHHRSHPEPAPP